MEKYVAMLFFRLLDNVAVVLVFKSHLFPDQEYSVVIGGKFSLFGCGVNHGQFGFLSPLKTSSTDGTLTSQLAEAPTNLDSGFVWLKVSDLISKEKSCEIVDVVCAESAMVVSTKRGIV